MLACERGKLLVAHLKRRKLCLALRCIPSHTRKSRGKGAGLIGVKDRQERRKLALIFRAERADQLTLAQVVEAALCLLTPIHRASLLYRLPAL
jgi:hypothetical protein